MTSPAAGPPLRLVIADDQASVRQGLVLLLDGLPDIEVVGAAADGEQALDLVASRKPDAILLDLHLPVLDGIGAIRRAPRGRDRRPHHLRARYFRPRRAPGRRAQLPHQGRRPRRHRPGAARGGGRADGL
jgi:Response regulator receiver domain